MRRWHRKDTSIEFVAGDVRDASAVDAAVRGCDEVHHLAFVNGTGFFYRAPELVLEVGVKGIVNVTIEVQPGPAPEGNATRRRPDISKLRALGFSPAISLSGGLKETVAWYDNNAHLAPSRPPMYQVGEFDKTTHAAEIFRFQRSGAAQ